MNSRGQTTQDFAVGVSVLLLTIIGAFVFSQGGALSVYQGTSPGVDQPQADRIATYIVENYSATDQPNNLTYGTGSAGDLQNIDIEQLKLQAGVSVSSDRRADPIVNVSIVGDEALEDGSRRPARDAGSAIAWGPTRQSEPVTSTRVVQLTGEPDSCNPICWLVVRVW